MPKTIAVIDGNSLMHRAFHAIPPSMTAPDGTPTNAVFGFIAMLLKFVDVAAPDGIVCAFDEGKPQFRIEALEQYKAQRPPMDDALRVQFPLIESLLEAMNVPVVKVKGWEGDDILGTVAARNETAGIKTLLVSGDKDVYQLVNGLTRVVTTKKGITDIAVYGPDEVLERYGVTPEQFPDYLGFMGDSSDNIPGVPGIGAKTAAKLLSQYGSMEGVYDNLDKLKGKQLENIRDNRDVAFLSRTIATIVCDLDFPLDVESVSFPSFSPERVAEAFHAIRFNAHLERLLKLSGATAPAAASLEHPDPIEGPAARALVEGALEAGERIGVAFAEPAQTSLFADPLIGAFSVGADVALFEGDEAFGLFARIVSEGRFAAADVKGALKRVYPADSGVPALVDDAAVASLDAFDLGLAGYVLDSSASSYGTAALLDAYLSLSLSETDDARARAADEAVAARLLVDVLSRALEEDGSARVYFDIDLPLVGVLATMERTGAPLDVARMAELGATTQVEIDELRARIVELAGEDFNVDSPKQLSHILFEVLELPHGKKTKSGYSTDAKVLKGLAGVHELPGLVLSYREYAKIKSTYIDALPRLAREAADGRVHTSFNETVTTTGRLSSSDPNLQNIPVRTDFGRKIRSCFGPLEEGSVFLSADYSQIELRLLAHLSNDEHLVSAFRSGADFHASTASRVFGVPIEEVTGAMRSRAKAVNFGIVYGQQAFGLAQTLEIPVAEAREMIERYFAAYPGVRTYLDETVASAREAGFAETMFGRKRHIPELKSGNAVQRGFGERTAMNHPMQGSAADIIKLAMIEVSRRLSAEGLSAKLLVQVHDELDFSVPRDEIEKLTALVTDAMQGVAELRVPLIADVSYGATWAEAH